MHRLSRNLILLATLLLLLLLSACQGAPAASPPEASPLTVTPTAPLAPSLTPSPTQPLPTASPTPVPSETALPSPTEEPITTLLFTGVIVPARCVQAAIDASGNPDYPYEAVRDIISQADLAIGTLNATISDIPVHTGCIRTYLLVGSSENADALQRAGFDVMSVATNHIKNCGLPTCGDQAFFDTLANLRRVGILPVGAGNNHAEAMQPVVVEVNGVRFGIVSLGHIEPMAFAGEDTPGIAVLNEENIYAAVAAAREVSDVVIFMPHWGPEDAATPTWIQRNLAKVIVEAGADLVVGNHTHVVQGYQELGGVPVFYGLGNFVFDQTWARDHSQGVILKVMYQGTKYLGFELIPTHVDQSGHVTIADPDEAQEILDRIEQVNRVLQIPTPVP